MDALDDLASDFSRFHHIRDAGSLSSRVFLRLASRLEAYGGVMAARRLGTLASASRTAPASQQPRRTPARYASGSLYHNNARAAESAPPATGVSLKGIDAQLGGGWLAYRTVPAEGGGNGG